jgi:serine/threonine protein phosphatase PrpC
MRGLVVAGWPSSDGGPVSLPLETAHGSRVPASGARVEEAIVFERSTPEGPWTVCLIAHGMMGQAGGFYSARIVTNTIRAWLGGKLAWDVLDHAISADLRGDDVDFAPWVTRPAENMSPRQSLELAVGAASRALVSARTRWGGAGATLSCAIFHATGYVLAHIGDGRVSRWRDAGELSQLTEDHAFRVSGQAPVLFDALGSSAGAGPDIRHGLLRPGDVFLFASRELSERTNPSSVGRLVADRASSREICDAILAAGASVDCEMSLVVASVKLDPSSAGAT